jgi:hypothetical protein
MSVKHETSISMRNLFLFIKNLFGGRNEVSSRVLLHAAVGGKLNRETKE